jgi:hypothetical protein
VVTSLKNMVQATSEVRSKMCMELEWDVGEGKVNFCIGTPSLED